MISLVTGFSTKMGIKQVHLVYFVTVFSELFKELNTIPLLALLSRLTPQNIEASAMSFFSSFLNFSKLISTLIGALLGYLFNIRSSNFSEMYPIVLIQCVYTTFTTLGIFFLKFPSNNSQRIKNSLKEIQQSFQSENKTNNFLKICKVSLIY